MDWNLNRDAENVARLCAGRRAEGSSRAALCRRASSVGRRLTPPGSYDHCGHMMMTSISELKARLSAFLDIVRQGDEVLVTDRGRVIARLSPVSGGLIADSRRDALIRSGRIRPPTTPLSKAFWKAPRTKDGKGRSLAALLAERREGW